MTRRHKQGKLKFDGAGTPFWVEQDSQPDEPEWEELILADLRAAGLTRVVVEFSGYGDSGQIDGYTATPEQPLSEDIKSSLDDYVTGAVQWDWNNEGSNGFLAIDVVKGVFQSRVHWPETTYTTTDSTIYHPTADDPNVDGISSLDDFDEGLHG
jgi:hypothetical protein